MSHKESASVSRRELTQRGGGGGGKGHLYVHASRACAGLGKQSALPFELRLRPAVPAAQVVSCSLADLEVALLKALPAISKGDKST